MNNDGQGCQGLCTELFALCRDYSGDKVPRPLDTQLHATNSNIILHLDFLYIGLSRDVKYQYLLLLKDEISGYLWLLSCRTADDAATVYALMR
jgi:hypothetical protein